MNLAKYLDLRYILIAYIIGLGWIGLFLVIQFGWWGLLIELPIILAISFPLAYWILKKEGWIEWAQNFKEQRYIFGLEIMRKLRPKKIKYYEDIVAEYYKEKNGRSKD